MTSDPKRDGAARGVPDSVMDDAGRVYRGMLRLALGSGAGRVVGLASIPVLSRLYGPEDFGLLAVFTSVVTILVPFLTFQYAVALPVPRTAVASVNLLALCLLSTLAVALISAPVLWALAGLGFGGGSELSQLLDWWPLLLLALMLASLFETVNFWATRARAYAEMARASAWRSFLGAAVKIGLGALSIGPSGLLVGQTVTFGGGLGALQRRTFADLRSLRGRISRHRMRRMGRVFAEYPLYRLPSHLLLVGSQQAPILISAALYDAGTTGQLSIAVMALSVPLTIFGRSTGRALYAEAANLGRSSARPIFLLARRIQLRLLLVSIPPAILVYLFAEPAFTLLLGENWRPAGAFASLLTPYLLFQFASAPLVQTLNIFDAQRTVLALNALRAGSLFVLAVVAWRVPLAAADFVFGYSGLMTVFYLLASGVILTTLARASRNSDLRGAARGPGGD